MTEATPSQRASDWASLSRLSTTIGSVACARGTLRVETARDTIMMRLLLAPDDSEYTPSHHGFGPGGIVDVLWPIEALAVADTLDGGAHEVGHHGQTLALTPAEAALLVEVLRTAATLIALR